MCETERGKRQGIGENKKEIGKNEQRQREREREREGEKIINILYVLLYSPYTVHVHATLHTFSLFFFTHTRMYITNKRREHLTSCRLARQRHNGVGSWNDQSKNKTIRRKTEDREETKNE